MLVRKERKRNPRQQGKAPGNQGKSVACVSRDSNEKEREGYENRFQVLDDMDIAESTKGVTYETRNNRNYGNKGTYYGKKVKFVGGLTSNGPVGKTGPKEVCAQNATKDTNLGPDTNKRNLKGAIWRKAAGESEHIVAMGSNFLDKENRIFVSGEAL